MIKVININSLYKKQGNAKLSEVDSYIKKAIRLAGEGNEVVLTGNGPIWLYLKIAHALHGKAKKLSYRSPVTGDIVIFDHNPYPD
jgi:hypothetical protein